MKSKHGFVCLGRLKFTLLTLFFCIPFCTNPIAVEYKTRFRNEKIMPLKLIDFLDSSKIDINRLNGKVLILSFWTTRCGACFEEFSALQLIFQFPETPFLEEIK
jgi:thiol-disulfide isomerase/thioredoxin